MIENRKLWYFFCEWDDDHYTGITLNDMNVAFAISFYGYTFGILKDRTATPNMVDIVINSDSEECYKINQTGIDYLKKHENFAREREKIMMEKGIIPFSEKSMFDEL